MARVRVRVRVGVSLGNALGTTIPSGAAMQVTKRFFGDSMRKIFSSVFVTEYPPRVLLHDHSGSIDLDWRADPALTRPGCGLFPPEPYSEYRPIFFRFKICFHSVCAKMISNRDSFNG